MTETKNWQAQTRMVHEGQDRSPFGETAEALYLTSGYVYDSAEQAEARFKEEEDGYIYSRFGNPTVRAFEERMMALEGAQDARATATGMAAVTACMMSQLQAGDHIVAARALFGSCRYVVETLMPRFGVACTLVDGRDLDAWKTALRPETKVLFLETPSNPVLEIIDIQAVANIAHNHGARLVVDAVGADLHPFKPGKRLLADIAIVPVANSHQALADIGTGRNRHAQAIGGVLVHKAPVCAHQHPQVGFLHVRQIGHDAIAHAVEHVAAGQRQARGNAVQQRCLPGAGFAGYGEHFAGPQVEGDVPAAGPRTVGFRYGANGEKRFGVHIGKMPGGEGVVGRHCAASA